MHFPREQNLQLQKRVAETFSKKKVTRIEQNVYALGNTLGMWVNVRRPADYNFVHDRSKNGVWTMQIQILN